VYLWKIEIIKTLFYINNTMPCYLGKIMDEIKKKYEPKNENIYTDGQNLLYEYASFLYKKDKPSPYFLSWFEISAEEDGDFNDWLCRIHNVFIKEFPEITKGHILKLLQNPKDDNVSYELLSVAPFELLEEFYIKLQIPPPPPPLFAPSLFVAPFANLILSTQKKAPEENIILLQ